MGIIFDIKKFETQDGPGIRTTVFLKGCPLRCLWCHNPESQSFTPELSFNPEKCIACGNCRNACRYKTRFRNSDCIRCASCAANCFSGALELIGKEMSVEDVMPAVRSDMKFYKRSGGGITVSGGEPLAQPEFTAALLEAAHRENIHTCLDTSGYGPRESLEMVIPNVDIFLYDLKETNPEKHLEYTGVNLDTILKNLHYIDSCGSEIILRCPVIPELNCREEHIRSIVKIAESLKNVRQIEFLPYHPLGEQKYGNLEKNLPYRGRMLPPESIQPLLRQITDTCKIPVILR